MELGPFQLTLVDDGGFRLDGGGMFGAVPKPLWEKVKPPDERNRIRMATNCLLVERGSDVVLIDTGIGDRGDARFRDIYGMEEGAVRLPEAIQVAGYELGDVTHVLLTHLHFDHCGWNSRDAESGKMVPTFPNARYWLERGEVAHAREPNARDRASYDPRNWEPLFDAGVVELFDKRAAPIEGVEAIKTPGHNTDMCIVLIGSKDETAAWWSDLVPTVAHVPYPWIMSYDLYPVETLAQKEMWLPRAAEEGWLCYFGHETDHPVGRLVEDERGRLRAHPVSST
ncbi:MAG: MBL fold metallo-hydrolase [bacterium]|nr:MBL fold metallo-hydrolase [bacterium]